MAEINIKVNGELKTMSVEKSDSLLSILRDKLDLVGAKEGCGYGVCGSCTVIMNGKPVTSCTVRGPEKMNDAEVKTIEGLTGPAGELHPIQQAFVEAGAVQCGFCTPGMVLRLYWLFGEKPDATEMEIADALKGHLCRCTGYETIIKAAIAARDMLKGKEKGNIVLECERI